ncbi:MAG: glycerophosphodiester phosphodiesterase family protein [Bacteriovoracia bacterium]
MVKKNFRKKLFIVIKTLLFFFFFIPVSFGFELIAHRGVHQTFPREGLKNDTCTASRIDPPTHSFLENTVASIEEAFRLGATMVEFDIHPTIDNEMVVFHDWTVDCRTNAECKNCITHEQTLEFLKTLDLGFGYTADGGKTYPFRGKFIGKMPTLEEVLEILRKFPDKKLLVNQKDKFSKTVDIFLKKISRYPLDIRSRVLFPRTYAAGFEEKLDEIEVPRSIVQSGEAIACFKSYIAIGWTGYFPKACRGIKLFVPIRETLERLNPRLSGIKGTDILWGWPKKFLERAHKYGTEVYVSQVDSVEELEHLQGLNLDGIMTNKIEVIGPHCMERLK